MQALVKTKPTPGLEVQLVPEPPVRPGQVRVRVHAAAICAADMKVYKWDPAVVRRWSRMRNMKLPHIPGHELAGVVVEAGGDVPATMVGKRVAAETHFPCGSCTLCTSDRMHLCADRKILGFDTPGGFADYVVLPACCAVPLPAGLSFEAGALCEPFGVAVHAVQEAGDLSDKSAWVLGCGPIGLFIVKLLSMMGVDHIMATDARSSRLRIAQQLGARALEANAATIDEIRGMTDGEGADVVFEAVGSTGTVQQALAATAPLGRVVLVGTFGGQTPIDVASQIIYREVTVRGVYGRHMFDTWRAMEELLSTTNLDLEQFISYKFAFSRFQEAFETTLRSEGVKTVLIPDEA